MLSCNTYHLTWVSLTLDRGYLFRAAPAKCSRCSFTLNEGYHLTAAPPDLEHGVAPLGPPVPMQLLLLEHGVAPFKVRRGSCEEIPLVQGKEQWLRFAGAAMKKYPLSKVRETQVRR